MNRISTFLTLSVKPPLSKRSRIGFQDQLPLNTSQKGSILQYFSPSLRAIPEKNTWRGKKSFFWDPTTHGIKFPQTLTTHVIRKAHVPTTHRIKYDMYMDTTCSIIDKE